MIDPPGRASARGLVAALAATQPATTVALRDRLSNSVEKRVEHAHALRGTDPTVHHVGDTAEQDTQPLPVGSPTTVKSTFTWSS